MSTSSRPLVAVAWLALILMTSLILVVGRDVLIPLALAVLIWQLINAIAARYRKYWLRGYAAERWLSLALGVLTIIVALASVVCT